MDRAQRLWSSSPLFVPLNCGAGALSQIIGSYLYTCGFSDLRTAASKGPRRNIEPGIFIFSKVWLQLMSAEMAVCRYFEHRAQFVNIGCLEQTPETLEHMVRFIFTWCLELINKYSSSRKCILLALDRWFWRLRNCYAPVLQMGCWIWTSLMRHLKTIHWISFFLSRRWDYFHTFLPDGPWSDF